MPVLEFDELLDSSDMGPEDWLKIAATIHQHYYDYDGFVCIHGTDTMACAPLPPNTCTLIAFCSDGAWQLHRLRAQFHVCESWQARHISWQHAALRRGCRPPVLTALSLLFPL